MTMRTTLALSIFVALAPLPALAGPNASPAGAKVYFVDLKDGDTIDSETVIKFGADGVTVAEAGKDVPNSGHFHVFVDLPKLGEGGEGKAELDQNIVKDDQHIHYGKAQTEAKLTLPPGEHKLQLVFADKDHIPHNPPLVSEQITVIVK